MLKSLFALSMMAVFAFVALGNHFAAMAMYWWYALFRPHDWMWWDVSGLRLPLLASGLFFAYSLFKGALPKLDDTIKWLLVAFAAFTVIAQLASACQSIYVLNYGFILILITAVLFTSALLTSVPRLLFLVLFIAGSFSFTISGLAIETAMSGASLYDADVGSGGISGSNAVGLASAMCVYLLIPYASFSRWCETCGLPPFARGKAARIAVRATVWFGLVGLSAYVYVSDSRGSAISLCVGGLVWVWLQPRRYTWLISGVLLGAVAFSAGLVPQSYLDRLSTMFVESEELDGSAASRPHFWGVAATMAEENPLGIGAGCYVSEYAKYDPSQGLYGEFRSVHSSYFGVLAELGYAGMATWILLHVFVLKTLFRVRRLARLQRLDTPDAPIVRLEPLATGMIASHSAFLVGGTFYEFSYNDITWLTFVFASSALALTRRAVDNVSDPDAPSSLATLSRR